MTVYPAQIDNTITLPLVNNNVTAFDETIINNLRNAIVAVQTELGVKPSATYSTVRARLDAMESALAAGGIFIAGGDLSGTSTNQKVIKIQNLAVDATVPSDGYVLTWSTGSNKWISANTSSPSIVSFVIKNSNYSVTANNYMIGTDTTIGVLAITLLGSAEVGRTFVVKDSNGTAFANNVTVITPDAKTIDGAVNYTLGTNYQSATFVYNGTQWNVS